MNKNNLFSRIAAVYRDVGIKGIVSRLLRRFRGESEWHVRKREADEKFDREHGVETGGIREVRNLEVVGPFAHYGTPHIASDPHHFVGMMKTIDLDFSQYTFIDVGSGMGRALVMASRYPFRRVIGIEFAAELHRKAHENIARIQNQTIELVHDDATAYHFPNEPLIVYLFNPFGSLLIRRVAETLLASWRANPRPILVLYAQPEHPQEFIAAGWRVTEQHGGLARFVPA